jgi:hypothetical protein
MAKDAQIDLIEISRTEPRLLVDMQNHYSLPGGFVGRNICYAIIVKGVYYGSIVGGSSTKHLPGRDEFFGSAFISFSLNNIINNIFFHVNKIEGEYPIRNFVPKVLAEFRQTITNRWQEKYGDMVIGFESLVELPRTGECYVRDKWVLVGKTKGFTCKRVGGKGTDSWSGKRVWDVVNLRPKYVFCRLLDVSNCYLPFVTSLNKDPHKATEDAPMLKKP